MNYYYNILKTSVKEPRKVLYSFQSLVRNYNTDLFIVSYPKTGRTWLKFLLGKLICDAYRLNEANILDTYLISKKAGINKIVFTHDGPFNTFNPYPYQDLQFNYKKYRNKKIIFLIRDVRDTTVSLYLHFARRKKYYNKTISDFVRDDRYGIKKIVSFYNMWFNNQKSVKNFQLIRYEDFKQDTYSNLKKISDYIGIENLREDNLEKAINYSSFENMKKIERKKIINNEIIKPGDTDDKESFKVRRGKIGGYIDYLNKNDLWFIDKTINSMKLSGCDWYYNENK